ncbi:hypothetical protein D5086_031862 [Populus alba]|uniref:Uncharacterized protein n=1 Tax=Populus alba TaxID=43335 RepID=A0ACC4AJU9_POPAL
MPLRTTLTGTSTFSPPPLVHFLDYVSFASCQLQDTNIDDIIPMWKFCLISYIAGKFPGYAAFPSEETVVVEKQQPYKTTPPMDPMFTEVVIVGDIRSQSLDRKRSKTIAVPYLFSSVVHGNLVGLPFRLVAGLAGLFRFSTSNLLCCSLQSCGLYGSAIWLCVVAGVSTSM